MNLKLVIFLIALISSNAFSSGYIPSLSERVIERFEERQEKHLDKIMEMNHKMYLIHRQSMKDLGITSEVEFQQFIKRMKKIKADLDAEIAEQNKGEYTK